MTEIIRIEIPGKPVPKGRARTSRYSNKHYTPTATRHYEVTGKYYASIAMHGRELLDTALSVKVFVYRGIPKSWSKKKQQAAIDRVVWPITKPDIDNHVKIAFDILNKVVITDDSIICEQYSRKVYALEPSMVIEVEALC